MELGPRTNLEIRRDLQSQMDAERWTSLDRELVRRAQIWEGAIDLRPDAAIRPDAAHHARLGRMQTLERLGLATPAGPAQWMLDDEAESSLRALGERGDIIKRLHRTLGERSPSEWSLSGEAAGQAVIGKLVARGLDEELSGTAYAIVDGVDGRVHHLRLPDLNATTDAPSGGIVELRRLTDAGGHERVALAVRSDLSIEAQATASGATWLDRRLVSREPTALGESGFGTEVRVALERRTEFLIDEGLARRQGQRVLFARDLLDALRQQEIGAVGAIDDGLGFSLVPWTPTLDRHLGKQVSGVANATGVEWSFGRKRGLGVG